jgi:hypothetical protein
MDLSSSDTIAIDIVTLDEHDIFLEETTTTNTNTQPKPITDISIDLKNNLPKNLAVEKVINGWTLKNQSSFKMCLHRLKYYRIINNFFFFELKKREGRLSWAIIVLSSISSLLSLGNTTENIFPYSILVVRWGLVLITFVITLISAYIKKQQFIDRINDIDRYLQKLNETVEDMNIVFIIEPNQREQYDKFCEKYIPLIKKLSVFPACFSPSEWKRTVYIITKYYPELTRVDDSNQELIWPWYHMLSKKDLDKIPEDSKRTQTEFGNTVMTTFSPVDELKANLLRY